MDDSKEFRAPRGRSVVSRAINFDKWQVVDLVLIHRPNLKVMKRRPSKPGEVKYVPNNSGRHPSTPGGGSRNPSQPPLNPNSSPSDLLGDEEKR